MNQKLLLRSKWRMKVVPLACEERKWRSMIRVLNWNSRAFGCGRFPSWVTAFAAQMRGNHVIAHEMMPFASENWR